jgi:catechol 2,3-dioxygenase-like lactoylglutathione lyase family enzyme
MMHLTGLDHIGFTVADIERSADWYTFFLGEPPLLRDVWDVEYVGRMLGYPGCKMECAYWQLPNGARLELIQYYEPPTAFVDMECYNAGNGHLCLAIDDLDAVYDRLSGRAEFRHAEPVLIPWGPYKGGKACYLSDPDGISIQLMQYPAGGLATASEA